jgi:hypothetical protein
MRQKDHKIRIVAIFYKTKGFSIMAALKDTSLFWENLDPDLTAW